MLKQGVMPLPPYSEVLFTDMKKETVQRGLLLRQRGLSCSSLNLTV